MERTGRSTLPQVLTVNCIIEEIEIRKSDRNSSIFTTCFPSPFTSVSRKAMLYISYMQGILLNILSENEYMMIVPKPSSTYLMFLPTSSQQQLEYYKNMP